MFGPCTHPTPKAEVAVTDTTDDKPTPLEELISERLAHRRYDVIYSVWEKAVQRLDED